MEFAANIKSAMGITFKAMARLLKLEVDSFSKQFGERAIMQGRFILYPPCPTPDQVFGLKAHSDRSGMTILLQDREVQGLQVLKDDKWLTVPIIPYALFVNFGDQMQVLSCPLSSENFCVFKCLSLFCRIINQNVKLL